MTMGRRAGPRRCGRLWPGTEKGDLDERRQDHHHQRGASAAWAVRACAPAWGTGVGHRADRPRPQDWRLRRGRIRGGVQPGHRQPRGDTQGRRDLARPRRPDPDRVRERVGPRLHEPHLWRALPGAAAGAHQLRRGLPVEGREGADRLRGRRRMTQARRSVVSRRGPQPTATYPHATVQGELVWVTAQAGRDPGDGELVAGGLAGQLDRAIANLEGILEDCGSSLDRVIRTQIMVVGKPDFDVIDAVYARRFHEPWPVRTTFGVAFLAAEPGHEIVQVQLDCVASLL